MPFQPFATMDALNREVESSGSYSPSSPGAPKIQREDNLNMQNDNLVSLTNLVGFFVLFFLIIKSLTKQCITF